MSEILLYASKVSLAFAVLTSTYYLLFRQLTFHAFNRLLLLSIIPLALLLPLADFRINTSFDFKLYEYQLAGPDHNPETQAIEVQDKKSVFSIWFYVNFLYYLGLTLSAALLVYHVILLFHYLGSSKKSYYGKNLVVITNVKTVFSCFNRIFIPKDYKLKENLPILRHEEAHVRLGHSYDLLLVEILIVFTWFNPFVYLFRRMLRSVHEYQADKWVLSGKIKKSEYLTLLLKSTLEMRHSGLTSSFKNFTFKNRIKMMTNNNSEQWKKYSYLLILPIVAMLIMSFSGSGESVKDIPSISPIAIGEYERISSGYGMRVHPITKEKKMHIGMDFVAESGTRILATANGTVTHLELKTGGYGRNIIINHGGGYETLYAQMSGFAVKKGEQVKCGDVIGYVGSSGMSTGPHLHYEVRKDGEAVNPQDYIN